MADTLLDGGDPLDFILTYVAHSTTPVTSGEVGITPNLDDTLAHPPLYKGGPPSSADLVLSELGDDGGIIFGSVAIKANPFPIENYTGLSDGNLCPLFDADLFERVHVIPTESDVGNILTAVAIPVEVWNAYTVPQTLDVIVESGTSGMVLDRPSGFPTEPNVYPGQSSKDFLLNILTDGPAVFESTYTFDFDTAGMPVLTITGSRVIAWPFEYERPLREILEFKTDIIVSESGNEQRISSRKLPRQLFRVSYQFFDTNERQRAMNALFGHHGRFFAVPLFHWARPLTQDANPGDFTIFFDHQDADFRDGPTTSEHSIMLWRSPTDFEVLSIVDGGLATPGEAGLEFQVITPHTVFPVTYVVPLQFCLAKDPISFAESQNNVIEMDIQWLSRDYGEDLGSLVGLPTLDGIPILAATSRNIIPGSQLTSGFRIYYDLFDSIGGAFESFVGRTVPETRTMLSFDVRTAAEAFTLRRLFYALKGKQKSFWLPTYREDFTITQNFTGAATAITIAECDYHRFVEGSPDPWGGLFIELNDGTQYFLQLNGTGAPSGGEETITVVAGTGADVDIADIRFSSLMNRARLNTDKINIEHTFLGNLRVRLQVVGVKE